MKLDSRKLFFSLQYLFKNPRWDTGISPPELIGYLEKHPAGRALDLGCGTGTNALKIAEYGWQVKGVDFVSMAVRAARRKARRAGLEGAAVFDVQDILNIKDAPASYDLLLDIGCFHNLGENNIFRYAQQAAKLLSAGGALLLYLHLRTAGSSSHGAREQDLEILNSFLMLESRQDSREGSRPSAWLLFRKAAAI